MPIDQDVADAAARIAPYIRETPVEESPFLSRQGGDRVFLKLENYQVTGSFKARGAMSRLLAMDGDERRRGFVVASSGNHGAAVAYAQQRIGGRGLIAVPESASPAKVEAIRARGAEVVYHGRDAILTERWARAEAERRGVPYVSPYNDPLVVAGQGTVGFELARQLERIDTIYMSVGGGGLLSGVAGYLKAQNPDLEVVGTSPRNSAVMYESIRAGEVLDLDSLPTLSDGTAGGVEAGAITFETCRELIDRFVLVEEDEIAAGMRLVAEHHHAMIEGAAGAAVAAYLKDGERRLDGCSVIVLCGANVSLEVFRRVLAGGEGGNP